MTYAVEFAKSAQRELKKLDKSTVRRVSAAIVKLGQNPRAGSVRPMVGSKSWRLRVGDYRVVYDILDDKLVVFIIRVRHRREVYRR